MAGNSPEDQLPVKAFGWAARDPSGFLSPFNFSRRATGDDDVRFKVLYCGICHTDLHYLKNDFGSTPYPIVPGHEIVGSVTEVGGKVTKLKVGDKVGVGYLVGSCGSCDNCEADLESYCPKFIQTFSAPYTDGTITYGGFSNAGADAGRGGRGRPPLPRQKILHRVVWFGRISPLPIHGCH